MDPENPIVKLCAEGMRAEAEGRPEDAAALFERAWSERTDAFEACVAAHYVARHQPTPEDTLRWNEEALTQAEAVGAARVASFLPSLYLNLGHSHETLGDHASARRYYGLASDHLSALPANDRYAGIVRRGVADAMRRMGSAGTG